MVMSSTSPFLFFPDTCWLRRLADAEPIEAIRPEPIPHQLLFQERPDFIPEPAALAIDESFWNAALRGLQPPVKVWLRSLIEPRFVPKSAGGTAALLDISKRV